MTFTNIDWRRLQEQACEETQEQINAALGIPPRRTHSPLRGGESERPGAPWPAPTGFPMGFYVIGGWADGMVLANRNLERYAWEYVLRRSWLDEVVLLHVDESSSWPWA